VSEISAERAGEGRLAAAISNKVVRVITDYTGRGPTRARAYIQDDLVSVVVQDTLTKGERSLVQDGRAEVVMTMRKAFQDTMRDDLVAGIEELTGRKVLAFLSQAHIEPDITLEMFFIDRPLDGSGAVEITDGDEGVEPT
jgi:uncharacterized protein YbcI